MNWLLAIQQAVELDSRQRKFRASFLLVGLDAIQGDFARNGKKATARNYLRNACGRQFMRDDERSCFGT